VSRVARQCARIARALGSAARDACTAIRNTSVQLVTYQQLTLLERVEFFVGLKRLASCAGPPAE
jgi:hypothetical protein